MSEIESICFCLQLRLAKVNLGSVFVSCTSPRRYGKVLPEMADTVGVSRSTVSRETIEASEAALKKLLERRFDDIELLIIYLDGMHFGDQCVLAAVGVDVEGRKHVLALKLRTRLTSLPLLPMDNQNSQSRPALPLPR